MPSVEAAPVVVRANVLVVDDHALLRTGVANIINQESDLHVHRCLREPTGGV